MRRENKTRKRTAGKSLGKRQQGVGLRKSAETLHESETRYKELADSITDVFFAFDKDLRYTHWNKASEKLTGVSAKDAIGKLIYDIFPDTEWRNEAIKLYQEVLRTKQPQSLISEAQLDGKDYFFEISAYPAGDGLSVFVKDITEEKKANDKLRQSEKRYQGLFENSPISLWEEDFSDVKRQLDGLRALGVTDFLAYFREHSEEVAKLAAMVKVSDVNQATLVLYKADSKESFFSGLSTVFGTESYDVFQEELTAIAEGKLVFESEAITQTLKGERNYINLRWAVAPGYEDSLSKVLVSIIDITERKQAEEELRKTARALRALSACNKAVWYATDESKLLQDFCRIVTEVAGYRLAWVGYAELDEEKTVRPVAQAGYEEGYLQTVEITWDDNEYGRGPTGRTIRTGNPYICKDIQADPAYAPWRVEASKRGYAASAALPLIDQDRTFGTLNIYAAELNAFNSEEVKLLRELADNLAYSIVALRTRAKQQRAEEALRKKIRGT